MDICKAFINQKNNIDKSNENNLSEVDKAVCEKDLKIW